MKEMLKKDFLPSVSRYAASIADQTIAVKDFLSEARIDSAKALVGSLNEAYENISQMLEGLDEEIKAIDSKGSMQEQADFCRSSILATMEGLRKCADQAEEQIPDEELPYPTYDRLLFSV